MGDMGELYTAMKQQKKETKQTNLHLFIQELEKLRIQFKVFNHGYHLRFIVKDITIDFWPSTNTAKIGNKYISNAMGFIRKKIKCGEFYR